MTPILPLNTTGAAGPKDSPEKIVDAAKQFESLLIEQVLRSMRESAQIGGADPDADSSSSSLMEFAEQEFSKVMSAGGGFGLAKMIADGLSRGNPGQ